MFHLDYTNISLLNDLNQVASYLEGGPTDVDDAPAPA